MKCIINHFQYAPPKSKWKITQSNWTPAQSKWTPAQSDWTPSQNNWTPPESEWTPTDAWRPTIPRTPMEQLVEMGFGDREKNQELLEKYNNNIERVVQDLLQEMDSNWHESRH